MSIPITTFADVQTHRFGGLIHPVAGRLWRNRTVQRCESLGCPKWVPSDAKTQAPARNGSRAAKGPLKLKGGIPLDELFAAHASGRAVRATEKTGARAPAAAKPPKAKPKKAPGRRLPRRDDAQAVQDGPPRLVGYARISTEDQTTALRADALTCAELMWFSRKRRQAPTPQRPVLAKTLETLRSGDTLVVGGSIMSSMAT